MAEINVIDTIKLILSLVIVPFGVWVNKQINKTNTRLAVMEERMNHQPTSAEVNEIKEDIAVIKTEIKNGNELLRTNNGLVNELLKAGKK